jgi:tRNA pseudouridine38-40 synthase
MKNFVLRIAYEGSHYLGWQKTPTGPSIEESLQKTLEQILQIPISLQAASRTDRGVHAEEQWVNFYSDSSIDVRALHHSLNALLCPSIRVLSIHEMPFLFHPTLHALSKEYHYHLSLGPIQMPHERFFHWHVPQPLDLNAMSQACHHLLGTHDFSSFCNFRKNLNYKDKVCHLSKFTFTLHENHLCFQIRGNRFLYKMVRNLVGTIVYVGVGKIPSDTVPFILDAGKRPTAGVTAPAHGLVLKKIYYPQEFIPNPGNNVMNTG